MIVKERAVLRARFIKRLRAAGLSRKNASDVADRMMEKVMQHDSHVRTWRTHLLRAQLIASVAMAG